MRKAYTLVELLVVIAIIGLMAAVGIPAYARYGDESSFSQNIEEIKQLFNQGYNLSKNPTDTSVKYYSIRFVNSDSEIPGHVSLYKSNNDPSVGDSGATEIAKVNLLKSDDEFNFSGESLPEVWYSTDLAVQPKFSGETASGDDEATDDFSLTRDGGGMTYKFRLDGVRNTTDGTTWLEDGNKFNVVVSK